jgi:NADH-quinone oxidoreductase subunit C/D
MATALVADQELQQELGPEATPQRACDGIPTFWLARGAIREAVRQLRHVIPQPFKMLYDVTAIDERGRRHTANPSVTSRLFITCFLTNVTPMSG